MTPKAAFSLALASLLAVAGGPVLAQATKSQAQPTRLGQFGDWQAFQLGSAKEKSCFAISSPKERKPDGLNRDPATMFVTHRPGEGVKNEISLVVGFPMKDGTGANIKIGTSAYQLFTKDSNAWVADQKKESSVIGVMKKGKDLVFEGTSRRGNKTQDRYSLTGLSDALDAIGKACK
jgi:hypothetical protein